MAKDSENMGGPTVNPKDEPRPKESAQRIPGSNAQSQDGPEGIVQERENREGAGKSRRSGSQSNKKK